MGSVLGQATLHSLIFSEGTIFLIAVLLRLDEDSFKMADDRLHDYVSLVQFTLFIWLTLWALVREMAFVSLDNNLQAYLEPTKYDIKTTYPFSIDALFFVEPK